MRLLKYIFPLLFCPLLAFAAEGIVQTLSVQEAYDAIPHKRIRYEAAQSTLPVDEAHYLEALFTLVDAAVVERVDATRQATYDLGKIQRNYKYIINGLDKLAPPERLKKAHELIRNTIYLERDVASRVTGGGLDRVHLVSDYLKQAYALLMQAFPNESKHNKEAFYQHLCALDYL